VRAAERVADMPGTLDACMASHLPVQCAMLCSSARQHRLLPESCPQALLPRASCLTEAAREQGSLLRATAATGMNKRSSRSHAIFTITLEQRRSLPTPGGSGGGGGGRLSDDEGDGGDSGDEDAPLEDYLCAKMHLVDLAGATALSLTLTILQVSPQLGHAIWQARL